MCEAPSASLETTNVRTSTCWSIVSTIYESLGTRTLEPKWLLSNMFSEFCGWNDQLNSYKMFLYYLGMAEMRSLRGDGNAGVQGSGHVGNAGIFFGRITEQRGRPVPQAERRSRAESRELAV